jgi:hypothetical protein
MTWQEELRQLDSALAGGELSANEYRKRRDEILAAASSAQTPSPIIGPPTGPQPAVAPDEDKGDGDSEVTQIVTVDESGKQAAASDDADSTQIISNPITNGAPQPQAAEKTQVVATEERTAPDLPQPPQWAALPPTHNANTSMFPPVPPAQPGANTVTPLDAQDLFTSNKPARGGGKPWLVAVIAVVVLALVGGAVWWFAFRSDDQQAAADSGATQTTTTTKEQKPVSDEPPPPVDITKIDLPGETVAHSGAMDIAKASELKVIAPAEAALLSDSGVGSLVYYGTSDGNYRFLLYSYESGKPDAAKQLTDAVSGVQQQIGLKPANLNGVAKGVEVTGLTNRSAATLRGLYTYGNTTIQLCVLQVPTGDAADLATQFSGALKAVTDAAPPTV